MVQEIYISNKFPSSKYRITAVQSDSGRTVRFLLVDDDVTQYTGAKLYGVKPSRAKLFLPATINNGGVECKLTDQMLAEVGITEIQVALYTGEEVVSTFTCYVDVRRSQRDDAAIESSNDFSALQEALKTVDDISGIKRDLSQLKEQGTVSASEELKTVLTNMMTLFSAVSFYNDSVDVVGIARETNEIIETIDVIKVTLRDIEVSFNQTGEVYTDDELTVLKPMLTVTALYDDGTSKVVSTYTLSGNLTEGQSTITVSYNGMTKEITVNVTKAVINYNKFLMYKLPEETVFDGSNVIETGVHPIANEEDTLSWTIMTSFAFDTADTNKAVFGWTTGTGVSQGGRGLNFGTGTTQAGYRKTITRYNSGGDYLNDFYPTSGVHEYKYVATHNGGENKIHVHITYDSRKFEYDINGTKEYMQIPDIQLFVGSTSATASFIGTIHDFAMYSTLVDNDTINTYMGV